jgi:cell shape-determining protein MreC
MTLLESLVRISEEKENELQILRDLVNSLKSENIKLRNLLIEGEKLRGQYVLCCALNVSPEIMLKYIK